jgi:fermentation-respiration switch protein FrsA (DUF1100 family)
MVGMPSFHPLNVLIGLCGLYLLYAGCLYILQHVMMFPGALTLPAIEPTDLPVGTEQFWVDVDGVPVEGWFLPPLGEHADKSALVVFAHGNAELIDDFGDRFDHFRENGLAVALIGYPGYGRSKGSPSERTLTETFTKAYDLLVARDDVDPENIIIVGRSMGGGAACLLADRRPSTALVLISTYESMLAMTRPYAIPGFLIRSPLDNISVVRNYQNPVIVLHGPDDRIIPYRQGVALSEAAPDGKLWTYEGVPHVDCPPDWDAFCLRALAYFRERKILP